MKKTSRLLVAVALALFAAACTGGSENRPATGGAGSGSGAAGTGAGTAGTGAAGTGTGPAGTGAAGTSSAAGSTAAAGSGVAGSTPGGAGTTSKDGGTDVPATTDGPGTHGEVAGPVTTAGCAGKDYQLCIDFESGIDTAVWNGGTPGAIVTDEFAHGGHAYRLYSSMVGVAKGGRLLSKTVGTIKNQVWGRFYIHFKPGAPGGHGNIVAAYDQSGTWYEMGYQFDGMMGVWHGGGGEHPRRSKPYIVDQWYCIETYFDGAAAAMPKWYIDGAEAMYYDPVKANGTKVTEPGGPTPSVSTQFTRLEAGFTPYAGLEIKQPDTVGDQTETRVLTDLWIDDIAFDTKRIGCIE